MQPRHAWTAGSLTVATVAVLAVTRRSSIGLLGNLWPWAALLSWVVLLVAAVGLAWWTWRRVVAVLCAGVLVAVLAAWALQPTAPRLGIAIDHRAWFEDHRDDFDRAAAGLPDECCEAYYGDALPDDLRHLTVNGRVSKLGDDLFFPQWIALVDDAGGYWYSPDDSPEGHDMYGMICEDPTDLGDGWWSCGM